MIPLVYAVYGFINLFQLGTFIPLLPLSPYFKISLLVYYLFKEFKNSDSYIFTSLLILTFLLFVITPFFVGFFEDFQSFNLTNGTLLIYAEQTLLSLVLFLLFPKKDRIMIGMYVILLFSSLVSFIYGELYVSFFIYLLLTALVGKVYLSNQVDIKYSNLYLSLSILALIIIDLLTYL